VIEVRGILGAAVENLGTRIVGGEWAVGDIIPKESDLGDALGVSRSVIRESLRILGAKGMIRSRTSDGTRVLPRREWRLLDPDVMDWRIKAGDTETLLRDLLKVRLVLEPGVVSAATAIATDASRSHVRETWEAKLVVFNTPSGSHAERRRNFIKTDLDFHRAFLLAVESELLEQLFAVISAALELLLDLQMRAKGYTTELIGMDESMELHEAVFKAFERGNAAQAQEAMRILIERAIADAHEGFRMLKL
jgi:GntR family transcriptional regulator, galactonate operon transcriptional repressor